MLNRTSTWGHSFLPRGLLARRRALARRFAAQLLRGPLAVALAAVGLAAPARVLEDLAELEDERALDRARVVVVGAKTAILERLVETPAADEQSVEVLDAALLCAVAAEEAIAIASSEAPRTQDIEALVEALQVASDAAPAGPPRAA